MSEGGGELRSQLSVSELPVVSCCVGFGEADGCGGDTHFSGVLSFSTDVANFVGKRERVREGVRESGCVGFGDADVCGRDTHFSGVLSFSTNYTNYTNDIIRGYNGLSLQRREGSVGWIKAIGRYRNYTNYEIRKSTNAHGWTGIMGAASLAVANERYE